MSVSSRFALAALYVSTFAGTLPSQVSPSSASQIRITLLGTAAGPPVRVGTAGISTLVEIGEDRFLFDAGRGLMQRLVQAGVRVNAVNKLFLTHLHSDHVIDVPDLLLMGWSATPARSVPLEVWGPEGTRDMMTHLEQAFAFDIHMRRDIDEHHSPAGIQVVAQDIREGAVYTKNAVRITAFLVDHGPVQPAYGYRLDFGGHSVCLSGDTRPSQNLVDKCRDVDVLIHEVIDEEVVRKSVPNARVAESIVAHHTTADQAADVFQRAHPRLAVFSHLQPASAVLERARRLYRGRLEEGDDLMTIDIGSEIVVKRPPPGSGGRS